MEEVLYYVYFLKSVRNGKTYVGFSRKAPCTRTEEHNQGTNVWTKNNGPFFLAYWESYLCEKDARLRESFYKTGVGRRVRNAIIAAVSAKGGPASGGG
jgi:putative endonuclease